MSSSEGPVEAPGAAQNSDGSAGLPWGEEGNEAETPPENRDGSGETAALGVRGKPPRGRPFQPGQSGNPGGRPKALAEVRDLAREHTPEAIETLVTMMRGGGDRERIAAATALLDRAWGRPAQALAGADGESALIPYGVVLLPAEGD
jgi:hypothetical protein